MSDRTKQPEPYSSDLYYMDVNAEDPHSTALDSAQGVW